MVQCKPSNLRQSQGIEIWDKVDIRKICSLMITTLGDLRRQPLPRTIVHAQPSGLNLRWLDRLKNDDIHQKYDVFRNIISKALEHLQKAF